MIVTTHEQLQEVVEFYSTTPGFAWDIETWGPNRMDPRRNDILWISFATEGHRCTIPMGHPNGEFVRWDKPLLAEGKRRRAKGLPERDSDFSRDEKKWVAVFTEPPEQLSPAEVMQALKPVLFGPAMKIAQNCLSGSTEAIVRGEGSVPLSHLVGQRKEVWTGSGWAAADFHHYGTHKLSEVVLAPSGRSRSSIRHSIQATSNHRWLTSGGSWTTTEELRPGLNIAASLPTVVASEDGIRHGFIFADGALNSGNNGRLKDGRYTHTIRLCGEKARFLPYFSGETFPPSANGDPVVNAYHWHLNCKKLPPDDEGEPYIAGFIEGWIALDGTSRNSGKTRVVNTVDKGAADWLVRNAWRAGYYATGHSVHQPSAGSLSDSLVHYVCLTRDEEMSWRVVSVAKDVCTSPVYCAEVVDGPPQFTLSGGILTGNSKFDMKSVAKYYQGKIPTGPYWDTMLGSKVLNNDKILDHSLAGIVKRELGETLVKGIGKEVEKHSFSDTAEYSLLDSEKTWEAAKSMIFKIEKTGRLEQVMALETDFLPVVCDMELSGATIDVDTLKDLDKRLRDDIEVAKGEMYKRAGRAFNPNSNPEKQRLLFTPKAQGGRGLKPNTRLKACLTPKGQQIKRDGGELGITHYSVSADALETMRGKDDLLDAMLEYADLNKLLTTYVVPYLGGEVVKTTGGKSKIEMRESLLVGGKVYGTLNQIGADTGRTSSSNPNLQNIPRPDPSDPKNYGRLLRSLFIAPPRFLLVQADYSQIEPRIIASLSGDPVMVKNYEEGGDIYTAIGERMGVERQAGKTLVLATAYGVGPDKIAQDVGCSIKEADALLSSFYKTFPQIGKLKSRTIRFARSQSPVPFVETVFGRRRYLPGLQAEAFGLRARAERQAFNTLIQGSAADIMKIALVRAHSCFEDEPEVNIILTVHDEMVVVTPEDMADDVAEAVRESMEGVTFPGQKVPLKADVKIATNWGDCK